MMKNKHKLEEFIQDLERERSLLLKLDGEGALEARFVLNQIFETRISILQDYLPETPEDERESEYDCYSAIFFQLDDAEDMMRFQIKLCEGRDGGKMVISYLREAIEKIISMRKRYKAEYSKSIYEN